MIPSDTVIACLAGAFVVGVAIGDIQALIRTSKARTKAAEEEWARHGVKAPWLREKK